MSDGFPELFNKKRQMFGYQNVQKEFLKYGGKSPDQIIEELKNCMYNWSGSKLPNDDVTFVVLKVN
jgi:serine phosphatase RsbU (regulator of sigma subunit)